MREYFQWEDEVKKAVRKFIKKVLKEMTVEEFKQEPAYVAALFGRLKGTAYSGKYGHIKFKTTIISDRGPNSAEKKYGVDFVIRVILKMEDIIQKKAVIGQAKKGNVDDLNRSEKERLINQIRKMKRITSSPLYLSLPKTNKEKPRFYSSNKILKGEKPKGFDFEEYIIQRLLTCIDGDTNEYFYEAIGESSLYLLEIIAEKEMEKVRKKRKKHRPSNNRENLFHRPRTREEMMDMLRRREMLIELV